MGGFFFGLFIIAVGIAIIAARIPFGENIYSKGSYGEFVAWKALQSFTAAGACFLHNVYLPKEDGTTTEVDLIMLHISGIYVIESKNYSGWIFGNDRQKMWTQCLNKYTKTHFPNPINQNWLHIKYLRQVLQTSVPINSVIVFSDRCTLKNVTVSKPNTIITQYSELQDAIYRLSAGKFTFTQPEVDEMYAKLLPYTNASEEVKAQHISNINSKHAS